MEMEEHQSDEIDVKDLNSNSSLPNVEYLERQLLSHVFANPVVHRGGNDHACPRAPTPGDVRMMFGTHVMNDGQPEYSCSPTTMADPLEWNSVINGGEQIFGNQRLEEIERWLESSMNANQLHDRSSQSENVEELGQNISYHTPRNSRSSFNMESFLKSVRPDEDEIKAEIEKIFAPFSEPQTDHTVRKEVVGNVLQSLISKFGLLRIYTTLKMVEDELKLQSNEHPLEDTGHNFEDDIDERSPDNSKCFITEISSNESVMKRLSADILHALFLKNKFSSISNISTTDAETERDDAMMNEKSSQVLQNGLPRDVPASEVQHKRINNTEVASQGLVSDASKSKKGDLKVTVIPRKEKNIADSRSSTIEKNNVQSQKCQDDKKDSSSRDVFNIKIKWLQPDSDAESLSSRLPTGQSEVANEGFSDHQNPSKAVYEKQTPECSYRPAKTTTGFTERAKLAMLKKKLNGKAKAKKLADERNYNHSPDRMKQIRLKFRKRNTACLVSQEEKSNTSDNPTKCVIGIQEFKSLEKEVQTSGSFRNICDSNKKTISTSRENFGYTISSEEKDEICSAYNTCLDLHKASTNLSGQTEAANVPSTAKWWKFVLITFMLMVAFCLGFICYTRTEIGLVTTSAVQSSYFLSDCLHKLKKLCLSHKK